jgi:UDP-N-acetylmuramoyl-tripeptide--D-alanyl-D-alanine ligase
MKPLTLREVAEWTGGTLRTGDPGLTVTRVSTDSRGDLAGALFVPLVGERHDAHDFLPQAFANAATAALSSRPDAGAAAGPVIAVDDTLAALQRLAARYRESLRPFVAVGVTGSNGKTSTKDFLTAVLSQKFRVHATRGNLNNHIGLPLTVLGTGPEHTAGVFEMGMNHFGEIAPLAAIAKPDAAVVTNIGTAHIEFLGSREGIAREKGSLVEAVPAAGFVVLNADDDMTPALAARAAAPVITAGLTAGTVRAENIQGSAFDLVLPGEPVVRLTLPVPGRHMIGNAVLAAAVGWRLGLSGPAIKAGLESASLHGGRLQRREVAGLHFLDDSYNANPDSMVAALRTLREETVAGRRIAVLGRMGELGPHAAAGHRGVGEAAAAAGVDFLLTVGDDDARLIHAAFGDARRSRSCATHADAAAWLHAEAGPADLILLKGSRSAGMEKVLAALESFATAVH